MEEKGSRRLTNIPVAGTSCASCAAKVEKKALARAPGVSSANVNFAAENAGFEGPWRTQAKGWCARSPGKLIGELHRMGLEVAMMPGDDRRTAEAITRELVIDRMPISGDVRVVAAMPTPPEGFAAADIRPNDVEGWRALRSSLEARRESRRAQLRFRRDPDAYLRRL